MKFIVAIIKPAKLEEVRSSLSEIDVAGLTVSEVKGFGRQKGQTELYRGTEYKADFLPKTKIELAVSDDQVEKATNAISSVANTGKIGDGKLFVFDLEPQKVAMFLVVHVAVVRAAVGTRRSMRIDCPLARIRALRVWVWCAPCV